MVPDHRATQNVIPGPAASASPARLSLHPDSLNQSLGSEGRGASLSAVTSLPGDLYACHGGRSTGLEGGPDSQLSKQSAVTAEEKGVSGDQDDCFGSGYVVLDVNEQ